MSTPPTRVKLPRIADKDLRALVALAVENGATASVTGGGHVKLTRPGCQPVFTSATPGDCKVAINTRARLRRLGYLAL